MTYEELEAELAAARQSIKDLETYVIKRQEQVRQLRWRLRRSEERRACDRWCCALCGAFGAAAVMMVGFLLTRIF